MHTDFSVLYQNYSNIELLKIILKPDNYQKEAVKAAYKVLQTRDVSDIEKREVTQFYDNLIQKEEAKEAKINLYKAQVFDLIQPFIHPTEEKLSPRKWLNMLLLFIAIQYLWSLYQSIKNFIGLIECSHCKFDLVEIISYLPLAYIPFVFFLLLKRKKWGWILLFSDMAVSVILNIFNLPFLFKDYVFFKPDPTPVIISIVIKTIFAFFLWKTSIASYFTVDKKVKLNTLVTSTCIALCLIFYLFVCL